MLYQEQQLTGKKKIVVKISDKSIYFNISMH